MELSFYKPTLTEEWINKQYQDAGIHYASDMDLDRIADIFGIELHLYDGRSLADWKDGEYAFIAINAYLRPEQRREVFFHELCHPLRHSGCQDTLNTSFMKLQEIQAGHFQLYSAMPAYMLEEFKDVSESLLPKVLSEEFVLPEPFVVKRLEQVKQRIYWEKRDQSRRERLTSFAPTIEKDHVRKAIDELNKKIRTREGA